MTLAPPRPAEAMPVDTTPLRRHARELLRLAAFLAAPLAVLLSLGVSESRVWASLLDDGRRAAAEVVGVSSWKLSDRIRVAFATPDGDLVEASIPVEDVTRYPLESTVEVAYDPANPRRVRTVDDWNPPYAIPIAGVMLVFPAIVLVVWRAWRWPRRLRRVAEGSLEGYPMVLESVWVPGRVEVPWAALWERDAPRSARPALVFRLAHPDDAPEGPIDVELVGRRRRRTVGFVRTPTGAIWPAGKMRPPSRSIRRALAKERRRFAAVITTPDEPRHEGPAGVTALPDLRGDLPLLPPEFFTKSRRRASAGGAAYLLALGPMLLATTVPFLVSDVVESRRHICAKPPAAAAGEAGLLPVDALASSLPTSLEGYTRGEERARGIASFSNPATAAALVNAGFTSGHERNFFADGTTVKLQVFQFATELGARRYEAQRLASLCTFPHRGLDVPAGIGASATIMEGVTSPLHRMTFLRGNRDYVVNMEGFTVTGEAAVLERLVATAR